MRELLKALFEAEPVYIGKEALPAEKQELVDALVDIQLKIKKVTEKVEELKAERKEIEPEILESIKKLKAQGIRLEGVLIYIQEGRGAASFKEVLDAVRKELQPKVVKLLEETYENIAQAKSRGEELRIKFSKGEGVDEGWKDWFNKVKAWFSSTFAPLVDSIAGSIGKIETLLGMK